MSIIINSYQTTNNFRGKWDKTEQGSPFYKTSSATIAGATIAVPAAFAWLNKLNLATTEEEAEKNINKFKESFLKGLNKTANSENTEFTDTFLKGLDDSLKTDEMKKTLERNKKIKTRAIPSAIVAAGLTLACGIFVDKLRNNKAKDAANTVKQVGAKNAIMSNDNFALSNKGRAYYESNQGSKYGAILGAGCGIADAALRGTKPKGYIGNALIFALGGWIMGKIADHYTNKDARKHA